MTGGEPELRGTVTKILGPATIVDCGPAGVFQCDVRARLMREDGPRLAVGDAVLVTHAHGASEEPPDPPYQRSFIDRLLVGIERDGLPALIVVNKIDLADDERRDAIAPDLAIYQAVGYRALLISADTGEGPTR